MISLPAKAAALFHGVFPGMTSDILALVNRLLPGPGDAGTQSHLGSESESAWSASLLTALSQRAAMRNNELP